MSTLNQTPAAFKVPAALESQVDELITHYPVKRSAALMILHALQDHFRCITPEAMEWTARKLDLQPINVFELVTFYPMFRQEPIGKFHLKVCRTLSCWLAGSGKLHQFLCGELGLDPNKHIPQTTPDGRFTVEFVECLASCGTAPTLQCNETLHEKATVQTLEKIMAECGGKKS